MDLRLSKLLGRKGVISFESNGVVVLVRGRGLPRLVFPGFRDIRGYRAMYLDFAQSIQERRQPEMSLERAIEDQRLMDRVYATIGGDVTLHYDIVIIGSGAGGGTMARALSDSGARVLVVERGQAVPQEDDNWNPAAVWKQLRYRATERWLDARGDEFLPYTHYGVGGNTKFWGSVLYRLRREDFQATEHIDGESPAWPIDYDTLEPYYDQAERLYHVHGQHGVDPTDPPRKPFPYAPIPHAAGMADDCRRARAPGSSPVVPAARSHSARRTGRMCVVQHVQFVPLPDSREERCRSMRNRAGARPGDRRAVDQRARTASHHEPIGQDRRGRRDRTQRLTVVKVGASLVIVSCGAVNSAALLLRSKNDKHREGLANSSGLVGRRYMAHLATMMQGFHPFRTNDTVFQKTVAINDFYLSGPSSKYPLGHIQSQGRTHGVMAQTVVPWIPLWAYDAWVARGVDWLAMSEDLPRDENRVTVGSDGRIQLHYRPNNLVAHGLLVRETTRILHRLGFWKVMTHSHKSKNTTHQCGTLCFGTDPAPFGSRPVVPHP